MKEKRRLSKRKAKLAELRDITNWENREIYCHVYGEMYVLREVKRDTCVLVSSRPIAGETNSFLWRIQDVLENIRGNGVNSETKRFTMGQKIQDESVIKIVERVLGEDEKAISAQITSLKKEVRKQKIKKKGIIKKTSNSNVKKRKLYAREGDKKVAREGDKKVNLKRKRLFERKEPVYSSIYDSVVTHLNFHNTILQVTKPVKCETCGFLFDKSPTKCPRVCICGRSLESSQRPNFSFVNFDLVLFGQVALDIAMRATEFLKRMKQRDRSKLLFPKLTSCCNRCGCDHHYLLPCVRFVSRSFP